MFKGFSAIIASACLLASAAGAHAQDDDSTAFEIDGNPVSCGTVPTVLGGAEVGDVARFTGSEIRINTGLFNQMPTVMQLFIYSHECGHAVRGMDENLADQFAVQLGKSQGWLTPSGIMQVCSATYLSPGDWSHLPGPARCAMIQRYYYFS